MTEIDVQLYLSSMPEPLPWQPYRPPVRFNGLPVGVVCFPIYRRGIIETTGPYLRANEDGTVVVDGRELVENFLATLAAYPVFVQASLNERVALNAAANARQIPHHYFGTGIVFRSTAEAVLARLAS